MKNVFIALIGFMFTPLICIASYEYDGTNNNTYKVTDAIKSAWGNPILSDGYIQDASSDYGDFRIKEGWACCASDETRQTIFKGNSVDAYQAIIKAMDEAEASRDDQAIIAMVARNITEHGAEFCLTQFGVGSGTSSFVLYHQQPNWPSLQCAWFCEPGWDGVNCQDKTNTDSGCNASNYKSAIDIVKQSKYTGNDAIALHQQRLGVADLTAVLDYKKINNVYPHMIVVGAIEFLEHGIVAKPISIASVGNHPATTVLTTKGISGKQKVLCAQGFTSDENCSISSENCGANVWCNGYSDNVFDSNIHIKQFSGLCNVIMCKDATKALNDNFKCINCENSAQEGRCSVAGSNVLGKCIQCKVGEYLDNADCKCKTARVVTKDQMQYGSDKSTVVSQQCWAQESASDYKQCVTAGL